MDFYVYQLRVSNEVMPFYVGKGKDNRCYRHTEPKALETKSHKNHKIKKALAEGLSIIPEFLEIGLSEQDAFTFEKFYIAIYGRKSVGGKLTNGTDGGDGMSGHIPSAETIAKLVAFHTGRKRPPETGKRISEAKKGKTPKVSAEVKARTMAALHNRKFSEAERLAISARVRGEAGANAKLTEDNVIHIYKLIKLGMSGRDVAKKFDVSFTTISLIKSGKNWGHLHHFYLSIKEYDDCL